MVSNLYKILKFFFLMFSFFWLICFFTFPGTTHWSDTKAYHYEIMIGLFFVNFFILIIYIVIVYFFQFRAFEKYRLVHIAIGILITILMYVLTVAL